MATVLRDGVEGKVCSKCKQWKPLERFSRKKGSRDGYNWLCKPCNSPKPRSGPPIVPVGKVCTQCHQWKPIEEYHAKKGSIDDHRSACKACTRAANSIENIQPLCRPCNCGKGARMIDYRPVTSDV